MFDAIFPKHWTTLQRLMWLKTNALARAVYETITGNPVSFTAKAAPLRQLSVAFSPVQDLHGYDAPWPAGGGVNKFDKSTAVDGVYISDGNGQEMAVSGAVATDYIPVIGNAKYYILTDAASGRWGAWYDADKQYISGIAGSGEKTAPQNASFMRFTIKDKSSSTGNVDTFAVNYPSSVTTYSPYSNICPISGWDSLNVEQRGKNLLDQSSLVATGITYSDGVLTGRASAFNNAYGTGGSSIPISVGASQLTLSLEAYTDGNASATGGGLLFRLVNDDGTSTQAQLPNSTSEYAPLTVTSASGKTVVGLLISFGSDGQNIWHIRNLQLELGSTASDYVPYNPLSRSISISLGSTVYSGTVDVVTGVGEIDKATVSLSADMIYNYNASRNAFTVYRTAVQNVWKMDNEIGSTYSFSHGVVVAKNNQFASVTNGACCGSTVAGNQEFLFVKLANNFSDLDSAKAFVTEQASLGTPLQVCYELAEPLTIQLTPQEVQSLAGDNTMWTDGDSLTVEYRSN